MCYAILVSCIRFRDHAGTAKKGTKKRAARAKFDTSLIKHNVFDLLVAVVVAKAVGTHVNEIETMQT